MQMRTLLPITPQQRGSTAQARRQHRRPRLCWSWMASLPEPPRSPDAPPPAEGDGTRPSALTIQIVSTVNKLSDEPWLPVQGIVTLFRIQVKADDQTWEVQRRYSDFNELNQRLAKAFGEAALPELPPKLVLNSDVDIAERYLELDAYLRKLLQITSIARNYRLLEFLGIAKQGVRYGIRNYECALRTDTLQPPAPPVGAISHRCACTRQVRLVAKRGQPVHSRQRPVAVAKLKRSSRCLEGRSSATRWTERDVPGPRALFPRSLFTGSRLINVEFAVILSFCRRAQRAIIVSARFSRRHTRSRLSRHPRARALVVPVRLRVLRAWIKPCELWL